MTLRPVLTGLLLLAVLTPVHGRAEDSPAVLPEKSVTVFPVIITPSEGIDASFSQRIAEVVGMLLERGGMEDVRLDQATFTPPETDDVKVAAAAFGQFVQDHPIKTDYALFGQFFGTAKTGPQAVRAIVVDKSGKVLFADHAGPDALAHAAPKPDCPMTTSVFLVSQVRPVWGLADPLRADAPHGKIEAAMRDQSGVPTEAELTAMNERLETLKRDPANARVTVYPLHLWQGWDKAGAERLADALNEHHLCHAETTDATPGFTLKGDPNEQKVLWDAARAFRKYLRDNPPATDYALLADYGLGVKSDGTHAANHVHLILCDRAGDWVAVDYQNSHHDDFQSIDPKSVDDCNRLVIKRAMRLAGQVPD